MNDISRLAATLMKLDDRLAACMRCGLCQAVCPVFGETQRESDVTRGKLALLENLAHKLILDPDAVQEKIGRCLLCGSCQANCPSGVSIMDIFLEARQALAEYRGLSRVKKLIFREVLTRPALASLLVRAAAPFQGMALKQEGGSTYSAPMLQKFIGSRHIGKLPPKSLSAVHGDLTVPAVRDMKVVFFPGCMVDKYYVGVGEACLKVLKFHGVGVRMPKNLTCCGLPALASGDLKGFILETRQNLAVLAEEVKNGAAYILTPCGSCTATIKEWWPHYLSSFKAEEQRQIQDISSRVMDINAFLIDVLHVDKMQPAPRSVPKTKKVTFHDSCHLKKGLGVAAQPRALIKLNPNYELVEMAEADRCCGCGGSFSLDHYDLATQIGERKRGNIERSGASAVATGCPACMMQLTDMLSQAKDDVTVRHPVEIYAETLPD